MPLSEHVYCVAIACKMTEQVEQWICNKFCVKLERSSAETIQIIQKAPAVATGEGQLHHDNAPAHASRLTQIFLVKYQITQVTQPPYCQELVLCNFWIFPKLKSPLKGKRFQTTEEILESMTGQLMVIGTTVWSPKVSTLKGTEASLFYGQCFLYLVCSSINVSFSFYISGYLLDRPCIYQKED